jgi:hypothetical protein
MLSKFGLAGLLASITITAAVTIDLSKAVGNLTVAHLNSGTNASATTYWRGDGAWASVPQATDPIVVVPKTAGDNLTAAQSGDLFTNTGAGGSVALVGVNDPTVGVNYSLAVTVTQIFSFAPAAGETAYLGTSACSVITSSSIGASLTVVAAVGGSGGVWIGSGSGFSCTP